MSYTAVPRVFIKSATLVRADFDRFTPGCENASPEFLPEPLLAARKLSNYNEPSPFLKVRYAQLVTPPLYMCCLFSGVSIVQKAEHKPGANHSSPPQLARAATPLAWACPNGRQCQLIRMNRWHLHRVSSWNLTTCRRTHLLCAAKDQICSG